MQVVEAEIISRVGEIPFLSYFGMSPRYSLLCGNCKTSFKKRFEINEIEGRTPIAKCPSCGNYNEVGLYYDGNEIRLDNREEGVEVLIEEW
jgi:DNA-directed RNA polymerase subunit RPC12/RpoP